MTSLVGDPETTAAFFDRTREALLNNDWNTFGEFARRHPLHNLLLESPFTMRAFSNRAAMPATPCSWI